MLLNAYLVRGFAEGEFTGGAALKADRATGYDSVPLSLRENNLDGVWGDLVKGIQKRSGRTVDHGSMRRDKAQISYRYSAKGVEQRRAETFKIDILQIGSAFCQCRRKGEV